MSLEKSSTPQKPAHIRHTVNGRVVHEFQFGTRILRGGRSFNNRPDDCFFDLRRVEKKLPYVMFNAHDAKGKALHKARIGYVKRKHTVFQDSGGFQLFVGRSDFIDPLFVAEAHQKYAHEGVGLDVPLGYLPASAELARAAAKVQCWNNQVIEKNFSRSLFYTSHGIYAEGREAYLKEMRKADADLSNLCIAGFRAAIGVYMPTLQNTAAHLSFVLNSVPEAKRVHALGVSSFNQLVLVATAALLFDRHVTVDSSRHIMIGAGGSTLTPHLVQISPGGNQIKAKAQGFIDECSCRMCMKVGYTYPYFQSNVLMTHAFISLADSQQWIREAAVNYANEIEIPFIPGMKAAVSILKQPAKKAKETMYLKTKHRQSSGLFSVHKTTGVEEKLIKVLKGYAKHYKKSL